MKVKLIAGLGNPEKKYEHTRHNAGFRVLDMLAQKFGAQFINEDRFDSLTSAFDLEQGRVIIAKPQTHMNNSGEAVAKLVKFFKIPSTNVLIVHDEIDLPFGKIKLYGPGSAAGHNGVTSIINAIGSEFTRLRIGIESREQYRVPPTEVFVLQNFTVEEDRQLDKKIIPAALAEIEKKFIERS